MSAQTINVRPPSLVSRAWASNKPLTAVGVSMIAVLILAVAGMVLDPTVITGAPAWLKPAKFAISISIYSFTFLWLLTFIDGHARAKAIAAWVTAAAFVIEMVLIAGAAALGTTSHFNVSTPIHSAIWSIMGSAIITAFVASLIVGVLLLRQKMANAAFAWSLRLGVFISAAGMGVAFFMTSPTAAQLQGAYDGKGMPIAGAHSVGIADGGPGLPLVGWSTVGGDLRAAHFFGLHALQLLPLLGWLIATRTPAWLRPGDQTRLVWTVGLAYLGFVAIVTWQALRAQPLIKPDGLTLGALGAVVTAAAVTATIVVVRARQARKVAR